MLRALLIDDERSGRDALRLLLQAHPEVAVVGEADTLTAARAALSTAAYDLVFLDIQLRGGTGFDLVPSVLPGARIIFVTAFDQHALRAFRVNALDYLLKPVAPSLLAAALARLASPPLGSPDARVSTLDAPPPTPLTLDDRVLLKLGAGRERFVLLAEIRHVTAQENYSAVVVGPEGEQLLVRKTMKSWESILPPAHFIRIHRQDIVNVTHAVRLERASESTSRLYLADVAAPLAVSYRYLAGLRARLVSRSA
jgi:two-component system, LytTR family, response regulator